MSMAVDGLISGLDTTSLINSLMTLEAGPQNLLKAKVTTSNTLVAALQGLNSSVASLATLANRSVTADSLNLYAAKSSAASVTVSAGSTATTGALDIVVDKLAQAQSGVTAAMTVAPDTEFILVSNSGMKTRITASSTSLDHMVIALNAADAGITATKIASGTANGETQYRLQLVATTTGAAGAFALHSGTEDTVADTNNLLTAPGAAVIRTAQDASVTLWKGTAAEQAITSSTNTFADLLPGVAVTVSGVSTDPVTISVSRDDAAVSAIAKGLVESLNGVFALISTKSAVVNSTDASGKAIVSAGVFSGDSTVRDVKQLILSAASYPVGGRSPSEIGISITKTGTLEFDANKFAAAMKDDPEFVKSVLSEISSRVAAAATSASDKYDGMITGKVTGQESLVKSLGTQIDNWDLRLTSRRATLERTYASLEVQLSNMNAQSAWLTAQVDGLNSANGK
ncbi:flagellar filament capping protein FliD [Cryobacterium ruanii]|uniref:Flagellar hook-associated protein 2 n=1 Tax=Cryobacterium ruanii TaxID=1259197 RepID=A0A4R9AMF8_9MICO|nr:flagellar filament capping protein FliD [Cryobacterium ruanii]TFD65284.1 flagellar hook-associated protein [Cryobacterium ruanii]